MYTIVLMYTYKIFNSINISRNVYSKGRKGKKYDVCVIVKQQKMSKRIIVQD